MRIYFERRVPGNVEFGLIYGGITLIGILAARFLPVYEIVPSCIFKGLFGLPCPTCGATRSILRLAYGDLPGSISMNPMMSLLIILGVLSFAYSLVTLSPLFRRIRVSISVREKFMLRACIIALVSANWIYLFRAGV